MTVPELQPDELEALQAESGPVPAAKVSVDGPVRTQELPRKAGATFNKTGVTTTPFQLLRADHRRAVARIISIGQPMYVALSQASAGDVSRMALWPAATVFPVTADCEVWVASSTATTTISVVTEMWATGE
jgi:hypothetical protein